IAFMMLANNDFAVQVHCRFFQWLTSAENPDRKSSLRGCLAAQVGSHTEFINLFIEGEKKFRAAWDKNTRVDFANALNHARTNGPKENGIPITGKNAFTDYWEYILPDTWFTLGY